MECFRAWGKAVHSGVFFVFLCRGWFCIRGKGLVLRVVQSEVSIASLMFVFFLAPFIVKGSKVACEGDARKMDLGGFSGI